jgi:CRP-like cAMP-binding protein
MEAAVDLVGVPLFERLDEPLREQINTISELVTADADAVLSRQGTTPEFLHILLEGQVALTSTAADDSTALVEVVHPGGHFVLASVIADLPNIMTARTVRRNRCESHTL